MEEEYDNNEINDMEAKLDKLHILFCESILESVKHGNKVDSYDIEDAIKFYSDKEEYEKCLLLKKSLK